MSDNKTRKDPIQSSSAKAAADVARAKLKALYSREPNAKEEIEEVDQVKQKSHLSKHQQYMDNLSKSGKSLAEIQTAWHNYYSGLSDKEKNEVWQEFYDKHDKTKQQNIDNNPVITPKDKAQVEHAQPIAKHTEQNINPQRPKRKLTKKQHFHSLLFGLMIGIITIVLVSFGFFNERFIAPFITPSKNVSTTPIIADPNSNVAPSGSMVIIPKINVEIPVIYDASDVVNATNAKDLEDGIQKTLEKGVVHYPETSFPGEKGNVAIVGHSSNNIFNQGKYKFAFVLLSKLDEGDTFYLTRNKVRYTYKIFQKKIVSPTDVSVLSDKGNKSTATLITCDPPGTSLNRLVVVGEQISPDPKQNSKPETKNNSPIVETVPGNAPSLWSRLTGWIFD